MRVAAADEHGVFLGEAEAGRGLARAGQDVGVACRAEEGEEVVGSVDR